MKNWYTDAKKREGGIYLQTIYFSERLLCQLERLHTVPLTLVEAPAGYGKTTALKHALRDVPYGALRWHNAQDATVCCDWLVRQIAQKDSALAQQIFDLYHENGPFVHAKPAEESSLYLMIDNFQVIAAQFPFSVLQLLSALKGTAVHVIFLSRSFWQLPIQDLMHVCYISKKDFFLRKEDIICFAEELGISLTEKQAIHIQKETGGWAAVVSLYLQNGCEEVEWKKLSRLMEDLFWRRQEDILKKALLRLAQFETVDVEMVRALTEDIADLQQMGEWFYSLPLLYYDAEQQRYCLCALLRKFLLYRLHNASFLTQWDSYHRCGCWYREHGETKKAVAAFYKVLDYAGILSCDLTGLLFEKFDKLSYTEIAGEILRHCPMETKQRYPLSLLRLCYALFVDAAFTEYQQLLEEAKSIICDGNDPNLLGEWELIAAFQDFPNLEKMEQHYQRAKRLMTAPSVIFTVGEPFLFGSISMWRLFYTKPGELERTAETLERVMKLYNSLTAGHGSGAAELYRGEVCCAQGRFADAEIYGYQALYASLQRKNACVTYGAALLLGTNAVYRGDLEAWKRTLDYLEDPAHTYAFLQDTFLDVCMKETVQSYFAMLQPKESRLRKRLQAASNRLYDLNFTNSAIKGVRIPRIILKKNYHKAIGILEVALKVDARLIALPSRLFIHTNLALCYFAIGRSRKAAEHLEFTLSLAERDQVLSFAAYFREYLEPLFYLPSVSRKYAAVIQEIRSLPIQNIPAVPEWKAFIPKQENEWEEPLSKREREIAELAARGLRNGEIAEMLHISEGTVKNHLKIVFRKLNIDRRSSLRGRLR